MLKFGVVSSANHRRRRHSRRAANQRNMCFNVFGFGAVHVWFLVSAPLCILMAVAGQMMGCTATMKASGYGEEYSCNVSETQLYLWNNLWQATLWCVYTIITLKKPDKNFMILLFLPFMLMTCALSAFAAEPPMDTSASSSAMLWLWAFGWFGLLAFSYWFHVEPEGGRSMF